MSDRHRLEVVRKKAEHLVLQAHARDKMAPGAISEFLKVRHQISISAQAIDRYLKSIVNDPILQHAIQMSRNKPSELQESMADFEAEIRGRVRMFAGMMDEARERYVDGKTVIPGEIRTYLSRRGLTLTKPEWGELMGLVEQQSLDRAILNMANASKEARAWLDMQLRLRQLIPAGDTHVHLTAIGDQIEALLPILCDCCKAKIAGLPPPKTCPCSLVIDVSPNLASPTSVESSIPDPASGDPDPGTEARA